MRTNTKRASVILLLAMALPVLLVQACGQPIAKDQGCPADTFLANSTDSITGPGDVTFMGESPFGSPYPGGTVFVPPVQFLVTDSTGQPRNNVCLLAYTGDTASPLGPYWYTDDTYSSFITGPGPFQARILVTNDTGVARVFWSSATLPTAITVTSSVTGSPPAITYTAGADQAGTSFIHVYSGAQEATFNVNWTVQGEQTP